MVRMTSDDRPKTSQARTSLVDSEWDADASPLELERATLDVPDEEIQTVVGDLERLRRLSASENAPPRGMRANPALAGLNDVSVDSLLESNEERNLPPPPAFRQAPSTPPGMPAPQRPQAVPAAISPPTPPMPLGMEAPTASTAARAHFLDPKQQELDLLLSKGSSVPVDQPAAAAPASGQPAPASDPFAAGPPMPPAQHAVPSPAAEKQPSASLGTAAAPSAPHSVGLEPTGRATGALQAPFDPASAADLMVPKKGWDGPKLVLLLGVTLPLAVGLGIWLGAQLFGKAAHTEAAPSASASAAPPPPEPSAPPPQTVVEKAASGDFKAQDALREKPPSERTSEETLAIAQGQTVHKRLALEGFARKLEENPDLLKDKKELERLLEFLNDRETTNQAAAIVAGLPGGLAADLFYEIWVSTRERNETTVLAEELVYSTDVIEKASDALRVALDLRSAEGKECERYLEIIPRAVEHGDRRSLHLLGKLLRKRGCGAKKTEDCFACLRPLDDDEEKASVLDAIRAARNRPAPKY